MSGLIFKGMVLHNFKSFIGTHEFNFEREPGLFYVSGKNLVNPELGANGCGKTTLWDALTWVCWGKTGRDSRPANAVIPWGLEKGSTWVSFKFRRSGKTHVLKRSRNPNALELETPKLGEKRVIAQEEIPGLLGMSEDMFRRTIVLGQFGSLFLDIGPEKQSQMFNEALDLDVWLRAAKVARDAGSSVDRTLTQLTRELSSLNGREAELTELLAREQAASQSYATDKAARLSTLKGLIAPKLAELAKILKGASPPDGRGHAKSGARGSKALQEAITKKRQSWAELGRQLADAEAQERALRGTQREIQAKINTYEASIEGARTCPECGQKASVEHLKTKLAEARVSFKKVEAERTPCLEAMEGLPEGILDLEQDIKGLEVNLQKAARLESAISVWETEFDTLEKTQNPHAESITDTTRRLGKVQQDITTTDATAVEAAKTKATCDYWDEAFKEIRLSLIDQVLSELEMAVSRHAENLGLVDWGVKFQTEKVTQSGTVSTAFTILLYPPGTEDPVKLESYSGGETQRLQLAVAFGLSEVILTRAGVSPTVEILDEPTRGLSSEGVEDLLTHLGERARELDRTIFVTEHHSLERGMFDGTIVIRKDAEGSAIVE